MTAPAQYELNLEEGVREVQWRGKTVEVEPIPWYVDYIQAARACGVPPWKMVDEKTPRKFWLEAVLIVTGAESAARKTREERAEALAVSSQQKR